MARAYNKKDKAYWDSLGKSKESELSNLALTSQVNQQEEFEPKMIGSPFYDSQSEASRLSEPTGRTSTRTNRAASDVAKDRFKNIDDGLLPFQFSSDSVSVTDAITLCQKAYFNVPAFKSTIDLLSEFTNTPIFLKKGTGSSSSRKFIESWFKKIRLNALKEMYAREYYRSGNFIAYALEAKVITKTIKSFDLETKSLGRKIPTKYIVLNPADIIVNGQLTFGKNILAKALTPFETSRLKKRETDEAKEMFEALPEEVQRKLDGNDILTSGEAISIPLDPEITHAVFYKKQDYEPLAVPMGFAVLDDINKKMELKKIDQAIARSVENGILLITMGTEPEKGGINHKNMAAMQSIFENQSAGRVLVSDWTTKADFIIPDLKKIMGKEKYEVLNRDIEEGLSNILLGESKFSDTDLKIKLFFQRLEEGRNKFLEEFLQPEIEAVCKKVGFRDVPEAVFTKDDVLNREGLQKLTTRMMELGILTPEQGMDTIHKGNFPESKDLKKAQKGYLEERKEGYYTPLVGGDTLLEVDGENINVKNNKQAAMPQRKQNPTISAPSGGRPVGKASLYSSANLLATTTFIKEFQERSLKMYKKAIGKKRLTKANEKLVTEICSSVVVNSEKEDWDEKMEAVTNDLSLLSSMNVLPSVFTIAAEHGLDDYSASLMYHSSKLDL